MKKNPPTFDEVSKLFHLPIHQAIILSGHDKITLTKVLRENGMKRWPYSYKKDVHSKKDRSTDLFTVFKVKMKALQEDGNCQVNNVNENIKDVKKGKLLEKVNIRNLCE